MRLQPLACQRSAFTLPRSIHYFDCAFIAPLTRGVEEAGTLAIHRGRLPHTLGHADFFHEANRARRRFARLVGASEPERVAVIPSVSYGLAVAARNLRPRSTQNIVVAGGQFPSNLYIWRRLADQVGCTLRIVKAPATPEHRAPEWTGRLVDAIDTATAVVALGTIHWRDGSRFDLEAIGRRARTVGAAFVLDGIQSLGALPFDLDRVQPDVVVCGAYKWLLGPMGIGLAWFGPRFDGGEPLEETWLGRLPAGDDFSALGDDPGEYQPGALRYDMGGRAQFILLPMLNAALDQLLDWGPERIQAYCSSLASALITGARELGYTAAGELSRCSHLFALRAPTGMDLTRLAAHLRQRGVFVSARGDFIRVSPHVYNDEADVGALLEGLRDFARLTP
ncbi:MAG: aminotransferase class V-fold PLP-dependent enzyme [Gemmatimonadales bacterium]